MSKLNLYIEGVKIAEIENKLSELNKYVVVVETKYFLRNYIRKHMRFLLG